MKKWSMLLVIAILSLGLGACNEVATPTKDTGITKTSKLTLQEVYNKSMEVSGQLESMKAIIDMKQTMDMPSQEMKLDISSSMNMEYIIEPLQIHQSGTTTMASSDGTLDAQKVDMEAYMTKDAFYMYEGASGQWMKFPQEMMNLLANTTESNPANQLKIIESYLEDFTFEQDNNNYMLTLKASGDKFTDLVKTQVDEALQNMGGVEALDMKMNINSVHYLIFIDKETFQTNKVDVVLDMDMTVDGETMNIKQDVKSNFTDFNKVNKIVIPQEVIDNAIEI